MAQLRGLHQPVDPTPESFMNFITCTGLDEPQLRRLHVQEKPSRWFTVKRDAATEEPRLWLYDRFRCLCDPGETGNRATGNHFPSIVSFVGNTSAGKSTIVRAMLLLGMVEQLRITRGIPTPVPDDNCLLDLLEDALKRPGEYSLPVAQGGTTPTTFGVHLYRDGPPVTDSVSVTPQYPLLLADCEGFRAGFAPTNAESYAGGLDGEEGDEDEQVESLDIKADDYNKGKTGIDLFYARLLYAVSDVIVFVTRNPKSKAEDFPQILEWAAGAMLKTFNQPSGKTLVVVCNKLSDSNMNPQRLRNDFLGAQDQMLWKRRGILEAFVERFNATTNLNRMIRSNSDLYGELFRSIHFCHIPDNNNVEVHNQPETLLGHFRDLKAVLDLAVGEEREIRSQSLIRYNVADLSHFLTQTFQHFCVSNAPLDFYRATCRDNPTPSGFEEHIANFLRLAYNRKSGLADAAENFIEDVVALSLLILTRRRGSISMLPLYYCY